MTQINTKSGLGNTSSTPPNIRSRRWILTINNYTKTDIDLILTQDYYAFQEEKCETPHLQVYIEYKNARTFTSIKKKFPRAHIEKAKNRDRSIKYCLKLDSRVGRQWCNIPGYLIADDIFLQYKPYKWQLEILDIIKKKPDLRKIYWYWDKEGGIGKSLFAKHLVLKYNAMVIGGLKRDILYGVTSWLDENELKIVVLDIARTEMNNISYSSIERLKNGMFFNGKYESKMVTFNSPHIIIFSNYEPRYNELSRDRWVVKEIGKPR